MIVRRNNRLRAGVHLTFRMSTYAARPAIKKYVGELAVFRRDRVALINLPLVRQTPERLV